MSEDDLKSPIVNCHIHTFTLDHVPNKFLPLGLTNALQTKRRGLAKWLGKGLTWVNPFSDRDRFSRFADFLKTSAGRSQKEIFQEVQSFYPPNSQFIVLPMDMAFMQAGKPKVEIEDQHEELAGLALESKGTLLPFVAVDPRRFANGQEMLENAKSWFEQMHDNEDRIFRGVKLYPPQGYSCADPIFHPLFDFCQRHKLPIMTHCSRGGVHTREFPMRTRRTRVEALTDPDVYREVCRKFPDLKICLAHFGGDDDWEKYFKEPGSREKVDIDASTSERSKMNWLSKIVQMIEHDEFDNLYTDISYTVFNVEDHLSTLSVFLRGSPKLRSRVLFGSDYYMTHKEKFDERYLSMKLRHELGEQIFDEIARKNPTNFLN